MAKRDSDYYTGVGPGYAFAEEAVSGLFDAVLLYVEAKTKKREAQRQEEKDQWEREMDLLKLRLQVMQTEAQMRNNEMMHQLKTSQQAIQKMTAEDRVERTQTARERVNLEELRTKASVAASEAKRRHYEKIGTESGLGEEGGKTIERQRARGTYKTEELEKRFNETTGNIEILTKQQDYLKSREAKKTIPKAERIERLSRAGELLKDHQTAFKNLKDKMLLLGIAPPLPDYLVSGRRPPRRETAPLFNLPSFNVRGFLSTVEYPESQAYQDELARRLDLGPLRKSLRIVNR